MARMNKLQKLESDSVEEIQRLANVLVDKQVDDITPLTYEKLYDLVLSVACGIRSAFNIGKLIDDNRYTEKGCYAFDLYRQVFDEVGKLQSYAIGTTETFSITSAISAQLVGKFDVLKSIRADLNASITTMVLGVIDERKILSKLDRHEYQDKDIFKDVIAHQHAIVDVYNPLDVRLTRLGEFSPYKAEQMKIVQDILERVHDK